VLFASLSVAAEADDLADSDTVSGAFRFCLLRYEKNPGHADGTPSVKILSELKNDDGEGDIVLSRAIRSAIEFCDSLEVDREFADAFLLQRFGGRHVVLQDVPRGRELLLKLASEGYSQDTESDVLSWLKALNIVRLETPDFEDSRPGIRAYQQRLTRPASGYLEDPELLYLAGTALTVADWSTIRFSSSTLDWLRSRSAAPWAAAIVSTPIFSDPHKIASADIPEWNGWIRQWLDYKLSGIPDPFGNASTPDQLRSKRRALLRAAVADPNLWNGVLDARMASLSSPGAWDHFVVTAHAQLLKLTRMQRRSFFQFASSRGSFIADLLLWLDEDSESGATLKAGAYLWLATRQAPQAPRVAQLVLRAGDDEVRDIEAKWHRDDLAKSAAEILDGYSRQQYQVEPDLVTSTLAACVKASNDPQQRPCPSDLAGVIAAQHLIQVREDRSALDELIQSGIDLDGRDPQGETILMRVAEDTDEDVLNRLIEAGATASLASEPPWTTALNIVAQARREHFDSWERKAYGDDQNNLREDVHDAHCREWANIRARMARSLIVAGADPNNFSATERWPPLAEALVYDGCGNAAVITLLLDYKADPYLEWPELFGVRTIFSSMQFWSNPENVRTLLEHNNGPDIKRPNLNAEEVLVELAEDTTCTIQDNPKVETFKILLEYGLNPDMPNKFQKTARSQLMYRLQNDFGSGCAGKMMQYLNR
jgi:hypothetical protein